MEARIKKVMAKIFGLDETDIDVMSNVETIKQWDSLRHMQLIIALESEFDIQFDGRSIMKMTNLEQIISSVNELIK